MTSLADATKKLRNSLRSSAEKNEEFISRLTPVVIMEDFCQAFDTTQGAVRPWSVSADTLVPTNRAQIQVQVPDDAQVIAIVDRITLSNVSASLQTVEWGYRARETAPLGTLRAAQYRDRRGVVVSATLIEPSTQISTADAVAVGINAIGQAVLNSNTLSQHHDLGIVLGPGDNLFFEGQSVFRYNWTIYGRERPLDRD